ncbi:hypothetical protein BH10ACI1_BH10ACI1_28620 [soil metagenome]
MKKAEKAERLEEIKRLYAVEGWTLQRIADKFGVSHQAINQILTKAGIAKRPIGFLKKNFDYRTLAKLYIDEKLTIGEVAKRLNVSYSTVSNQLERNGIEKRSSGFFFRKQPELYQMQIGESVLIKRPETSNPYVNLYGKAKKIGIKISIKTVDKDTLKISRIS